jgi:hypothetical protein
VNGDRFKTSTNYFESNVSENETPFKLQYLQGELKEETYYPGELENYNRQYVDQEITDTNPFKKDLLLASEINTVPDIYNEHLFENYGDFELFSNEIHDLEFSDMLGQISSEAEEKFQNFINNNSNSPGRELDESLADPNFESTFDQFFETTYGPLAYKLENEIDRLSAHIQQNIHPGMSYEGAQSAIESFQVEPDQLFGSIGKFLNKVKKGVSTVLKKGASIAKAVISGPLQILLSRIKPLIKPMLRKLVKKGLGLLPEKYRSIAQKALEALGIGGKQGEISEEEPQSEIIANNTSSLSEALYEDVASEETVENQLYDTDETEREFDRQIFLLSRTEPGEPSQQTAMYEYPDSEEPGSMENEVTSLNQARDDFIHGVITDPSDIKGLTQNFIPAILPALKLGIRLAGRPRVVNFIASVVAKLLEQVLSKDQATPISRMLVDAGLKLVNLETFENIPRDQYLGATISNIVSETTDMVSQLPSSLLEAGEDVLQPFVQEALLTSTANNVNIEVLNDGSIPLRQLPQDAYWVLRNKGKYKVLSKKYSLILDPKVASSVRTHRRAETLSDILRNYQGWDGKTPIHVIIRVFEATPLTRLSMIAKDYVGGKSYNQIKQIIKLGKSAATLLLKEPHLASGKHRRGSIAGLRFYYVKLDTLSNKSTPSAAAPADTKERSNDANLRLVPPDLLQAGLYLNPSTCQRIRDVAGSIQGARLYNELETILLPTGQKIINNLLSGLNVPSFASKEIQSQIFRWILNNLKSYLSEITRFLGQGPSNTSSGVSIILDIKLPADFLTSITKLSIEKVAEFISKLVTIRPSAKINLVSGYKL